MCAISPPCSFYAFPLLMLMLNRRYSAQVALDRRDEMDVEGWKVGDPYVPLYSVDEKECLRC